MREEIREAVTRFFDECLTSNQVAQMLGVSQVTVSMSLAKKSLNPIRTPFGYLFFRDEIEEFAKTYKPRRYHKLEQERTNAA